MEWKPHRAEPRGEGHSPIQKNPGRLRPQRKLLKWGRLGFETLLLTMTSPERNLLIQCPPSTSLVLPQLLFPVCCLRHDVKLTSDCQSNNVLNSSSSILFWGLCSWLRLVWKDSSTARPRLGKAVDRCSLAPTSSITREGLGLHPGQQSMALMASGPLGAEGFQPVHGSSKLLINPTRQRFWELLLAVPWAPRTGHNGRRSLLTGSSDCSVLGQPPPPSWS